MEEEQLATGIGEVLGEHGIDAGGLRLTPIPGGASRETWMAESDAGRWVLRRDPRGSVSLVPMEDEFALIRAAADAGVRVPKPLAFEPDAGRFESPGLLMAYIEGTSVAPRILRKAEFENARTNLPGQLAESLARIHAIETAKLDGVVPASASDPAVAQIDEWERQLD